MYILKTLGLLLVSTTNFAVIQLPALPVSPMTNMSAKMHKSLSIECILLNTNIHFTSRVIVFETVPGGSSTY